MKQQYITIKKYISLLHKEPLLSHEIRGYSEFKRRIHFFQSGKRYPENKSEYEIIISGFQNLIDILMKDQVVQFVSSEFKIKLVSKFVTRDFERSKFDLIKYYPEEYDEESYGKEFWLNQFSKTYIKNTFQMPEEYIREIINEGHYSTLIMTQKYIIMPYDGGIDIVANNEEDIISIDMDYLIEDGENPNIPKMKYNYYF